MVKQTVEEKVRDCLQGTCELRDLLADGLCDLDVEYVFGVAGGAIDPLYEGLRRVATRGRRIAPVICRQAASAVFMAAGYAQESGRLGVCCATAGPAAAELLAGLSAACVEHVPMLVITAQPSPGLTQRPLQGVACSEASSLAMFGPVTTFNASIANASELVRQLSTAVFHATRLSGGPAHLMIPSQLLASPVRPVSGLKVGNLARKDCLVDEAAVQVMADRVARAERIVLVVGAGCRDATAHLMEFAQRERADVVSTPQGKRWAECTHAQYRGVLGYAGHEEATRVLCDSAVDLVVAAGTSVHEFGTDSAAELVLGRDNLIHVDENPVNLSASLAAQLQVQGAVKRVFELVNRLRSRSGDLN